MRERSTLPDYAAVRHVLTAPHIAARTTPHIGEDDFDFAGLAQEAETMSSGEALLIQIASDLWHAERTAGVFDLARRLDDRNFERVVEALELVRRPLAA